MNCPSCDQPASGKFCATCGARLVQACPQCRAEVALGSKFCNECGAAMPAATASAKGPSVTIGDIGVMRGTIDLSTHTHSTVGSQTNVAGDLHIQMGQPEPTYDALLAQGKQALGARMYVQAKETFAKAAQREPHQAEAHYYLALATLQGHRPKLVRLATAQAVEQCLQAAVAADDRCGCAYVLWAIVKQDAYVLNGMNPHTPPIDSLVEKSGSVELGRLREIVDHINAPGNRIWEAVTAATAR